MRILSLVLILFAGLLTGALLADGHDGPGNEAGSGGSEHPGTEAPSQSASPSTTPTTR